MADARTAVNQPPSGGTLYPFAAPGALVAGVLDAYLSYQDDACQRAYPFDLTLAGTAGSFTATVADADAVPLVTAASAAATSTAWGDRTIYEWVGADTVLRLVLRPADFAAGTGTLDPRTVNRLPKRVRSIRVGAQTFTGPVVLEAGYNVTLDPADASAVDGGRYTRSVTLAAVPGSGAGRSPGCEDTATTVKAINEVGPDAGGNLSLDMDECYRAQVPVAVAGGFGTVTPATLRLSSDCRPCCECDYFVRVYKGLKAMWDRWKAVAAGAEAVRDLYADNKARWEAGGDCRLADQGLHLVVTRRHACKVFVGASACNRTACCVLTPEIRFTFQVYANGAEIAWPGGTVLSATLEAGGATGEYGPEQHGPVIRFRPDYVDPGGTIVATMVVCVKCAPDPHDLSPPLMSVKVTVTYHAPDATDAACVVPAVTVPSAVTDVWAASGVADDNTARAVKGPGGAALTADPATFDCTECG